MGLAFYVLFGLGTVGKDIEDTHRRDWLVCRPMNEQ
jgi:hypothetical protein